MIVRDAENHRKQGYILYTAGQQLPTMVTFKGYDFDEEYHIEDLEALINEEWTTLITTEGTRQ